MKLLLERRDFSDRSTIGLLYVNGVFQCYTLEDADRKLEEGGKKIYAETAIPRGTYSVIVNWSNRFKQKMPLLLDVPQFEGIRIHAGNGPKNTEGCILVGSAISSERSDWLLNSRAAYAPLFRRIDGALSAGGVVEIEVR